MYYYAIILFPIAIDNFNRVVLQMKTGIGGSDYINASYIDVRNSAIVIIVMMLVCIMLGLCKNGSIYSNSGTLS